MMLFALLFWNVKYSDDFDKDKTTNRSNYTWLILTDFVQCI